MSSLMENSEVIRI